MSKASLRTGTAPKQARSEQTLQRILDAAEALICERGLAAVSIAAIVRSAGSSVGGFYGRFKDKDELLLALSERQQGAIRDQLAALGQPETWVGLDLRAMVQRLVMALQQHLEGRERLIAACLEAAARHPERWAPAAAFRNEVVDRAIRILLLRQDEFRHDDPELAAGFAIRQAFALFDVRCLYETHAPNPGDAVMGREAARSIAAYLTSP
ncbi:MAG: helix-turn-helix domain-containing protein [Myxococcota bacterium]